MTTDDSDWPRNYFNYFTEIEEHFQRVRGSSLFLLSPLDWAIIESWKVGGVPLEAVLKGIDDAFEKWHSRKIKRRQVNSLAYCSQAVMDAAQRMSSRSAAAASVDAPFQNEELSAHLNRAAEALRNRLETGLHDVAAALEGMASSAAEHAKNLEDLERRLTALEDKIVAIIRSTQTEEDLYEIRSALDRELKPYRGKMSAEQLAMLERRYLDTATLERASVPRLSLFYLR
jgi:hypothetical protein